MGSQNTKPSSKKTTSTSKSNKHSIPDQFSTMEELQQALRNAGLESSNLLIGVDYTKSNTWTGKVSFGGQCLHYINPQYPIFNPYQRVIDAIGRALEPFDDDRLIPTYGFGDVTTTNKSLFSFMPNEAPCAGVAEVLRRYNEITPSVQMSGPTNFAPLIRKAIDIVRATHSYHILLIICDGQVDNEKDTTAAIIEASNYPLSIVAIGVGDGPFDKMENYDDNLTESKFDNFQFVNFYEVVSARPDLQDIVFAVKALQEIPDQYAFIKEHGYLDN
ncbi:hypothetical protein ENUP19_0252G0077 [Entamoeba nuttalli]|uniref:Copine, putative n=2 Tax=Entamoeba nuttalli TaxID=412467 RepID=K2HUI2_ENTNP|nr:copine, putative [Entamoeba nuttalli P19]EKE39885.1 copine, putative [Entamoeba nuttalli P19]|eukprot:XP_008857789.1 copine, putative [Entamoeba nuttalli P19]